MQKIIENICYVFFYGIVIPVFYLTPSCLYAQSSDNGNGTFSNPVLWGDFPDPEVIRVGESYYMMSTSMHYFPGVTLMESKDLVNWGISSNVVEEFKEHPYYDLEGGHRYAKGQWATSMKYFNGEFHILFTTLTEGSYIYTSPDAKGPWKKHKIDAFLYDPGMFVDHDGRLYVISGNTDIFLTELDPVTLQSKGPQKQIYKGHRNGLEGNRCYRIGEYYYIFCTYGGIRGTQICLRGKSLTGPFEEREIMKDMANRAPFILHQGCLIDLPDGSYWSMIFQDHGGLGRIPYLVPVYWAADWPVLGNPMDGNITLDKPIAGTKIINFPTTDEFDDSMLGLQWQFNHNPDKSKYSLTEKKGNLRLYTATTTDSLLKARNTICQRIFGPYSVGTVKLNVSKMKVGDKAGLVVLQDPFATLTVHKTRKGNQLLMTVNEEVKNVVNIQGATIYLRAKVDGISDKINFFYSTDDTNYHPLGDEFRMQFNLSIFVGNRYGIFNYATERQGGYVDVDWFRVKQEPLFSRECGPGKILETEWFDYHYLAEVRLSENDKSYRNQDMLFPDGGLIGFRNLEMTDSSLNGMEFTVCCKGLSDAVIEVRYRDTGEVIGTVVLPQETKGYETVTLHLEKPLISTECLEVRVWKNKNPEAGEILIDKIRLSK